MDGQRFSVEGGVLVLGGVEFLGKKCQWYPFSVDKLLQHGSHHEVSGIRHQGSQCIQAGVTEQGGGGEGRFHCLEVVSTWVVHWFCSIFFFPAVAANRGAIMLFTLGIKQLSKINHPTELHHDLTVEGEGTS